MKKTVLLSLLGLMPLFMIASVFNLRQVRPEHQIRQALSNARAWRLSEVIGYYNDLDIWQMDDKSTFVYNDVYPNRIDQVTFWSWDSGSADWDEYMVYNFTYDPSGQYIVEIMAFIYTDVQVPYFQATFQYDAQNRLTHSYASMYDIDVELWDQWQRLHIVYENNANYSVYTWMIDIEGEAEYHKINFQWDAQGRIIEELESDSPDSLNWELSSKMTRSYHPSDTTTGDIIVQNIARFFPMMFISDYFEPNFFGKAAVEIDYWRYAGGWLYDYKTTYVYDGELRLIHEVDEIWAFDSWVSNELSTQTYDTDGNLATRVDSYWDNMAMEWYEHWMDVYNWEFFTSIDDHLAPPRDMIRISAYPTPFNQEVSITLASKSNTPVKVNIYNQKGQLVRSFDASTNTTIAWDGKSQDGRTVGSGIYFVRAAQDGVSSIRRIVKIK